MPPLTDLLDKPIRDPNGDAVASLHDLVVRIDLEQPDVYPVVSGIVARLKSPVGARDVYLPWEKVESLGLQGAELKVAGINMLRFMRREGEIVLRDGLFDKQVVDIEGRRVVRINDLDLEQRNGVWRLVGVDVSPGALLRRLGMKRLSRRVSWTPLIDWAQVVPVAHEADEGGALRLRVPRAKLELLKPAELARVVEQLPPRQGADLLGELDDSRAADTLEELEDEQQGQILRAMDPERAADVLEEMEPDEATDALQSVSDAEAADLLKRMSRDEADEVQELLGYPDDSAGGLMTTEYVSVPDWATVGEILSALRAQAKAAAEDEEGDPLPDALSEVFVVMETPAQRPPVPSRPPAAQRGRNGIARPVPARRSPPSAVSVWTEGRLVGIVTLRDLLLADPESAVSEVMRPPKLIGHPLDNEQDTARMIADEDLLALPIVDDAGLLLGIVTVDDAIDVILPTAWKKRMPRLFH